jgi:cell division protein FtsW (lipid II flippase)
MLAQAIKTLLKPNPAQITALAAIGLVVIGLGGIEVTPDSYYATRQAVILLIGLAMMALVVLPHHKLIGELTYPLSVVVLVLLVILLIPGLPKSVVPVVNGARRWIDLQVIPRFQPSELAKIVYVLVLARYLRYRHNYRTLWGLLIPFAITAVPMALIYKEPDLSTALIFVPVLFAMLLAAGALKRHILLIVTTGLAIVACVLVIELVVFPDKAVVMSEFRVKRVQTLVRSLKGEVDSEKRMSDDMQSLHARGVAGSGQLMGLGKERIEVILRYYHVPEAHNDMIFSVICGRWGLVGGALVLLLYMVLIGSALIVAAAHKDPFARLVVVGVVAVIITQVFVNVGMNVGLLPVTGMPLPFVGYGGTSLVTNFMMIGLVMNAAVWRPTINLTRPAFEYTRGAA